MEIVKEILAVLWAILIALALYVYIRTYFIKKKGLTLHICGHIIDGDQIVGIGPLMTKFSSDTAIQMAYNRQKLYFHLHVKNQSLLIESDWMDFAGVGGDTVLKNNEKWKAFKNDYKESKEQIERMLNKT